MDTKTLALDAFRILSSGRTVDQPDGMVIDNDWSVVYNDRTGQSKRVLLHVASSMVFKYNPYGYRMENPDWSGRTVGTVDFDGIWYNVRLPRFEYHTIDGEPIEVQEFVQGEFCECSTRPYDYENRCPRPRLLRDATDCNDCHCGNWKFCNDGTIVLFDFDGIRL